MSGKQSVNETDNTKTKIRLTLTTRSFSLLSV